MNPLFLKNIRVDDALSDIVVSDGLIRRIRPAGEMLPAQEAEVFDCDGKTALPGLVNMHTHAAMALMRGIQEDVAFDEWLAEIWRIEQKLDEEFIYHSTRVAVLEMIKTGTTTFTDQYWYYPVTARAAHEMGIRPALGFVVLDQGGPSGMERQKEDCIRQFEEAKAIGDGSLPIVNCHAVYSVSEPMILWATEFARKNHLKFHIHVSETAGEVRDCKARHGGLSPVEYLDRLGVLDDQVIAAHCMWLSDEDVRILGERKVNVVHNINSNLKLASGHQFRYDDLRDAGANVCIGTDGCASSNNLDMVEAMKTAALIQKGWRDDPKALPLHELIDCATIHGAKALGIDAGRIAEGAIADILIVDTDNTFFLSPGSFLANFIYSAHSECIDSVVAGGKLVMRGRVVPGEKEILAEARKMLSKIS